MAFETDLLQRRQELVLRRVLQAEVNRAGQLPRNLEAWGAEQADLGGHHSRLRAALEAAGLRCYRFLRVASDYYSTTLDERRACLQATSVEHLCKTITVENTAWSPELASPSFPRHMLVLVQYSARFDEAKLKAHTYALNCGRIKNKRICWRLAPAEES
jgi:hypothetical protein